MKIKVVREPLGDGFSGHVSLFAWSESSEDFVNELGDKIYALAFDFYAGEQKSVSKIVAPMSYYENHNSVIFDTQFSLSNFYYALEASDFATGISFNTRRKNCVHAIQFALSVAKINVKFDERPSCKHLAYCLWSRSTLITPRELINTLKEIKNNPFNNQCDLEVPLISSQSSVLLSDDHKAKLEYIKRLEKNSVKDERMFTSCLSVGQVSSLGILLTCATTAGMLGSNKDDFTAPPVLILISMIAVSVCLTIVSCGTARFFKSKVAQRKKETEEKFHELYGDASPVPTFSPATNLVKFR